MVRSRGDLLCLCYLTCQVLSLVCPCPLLPGPSLACLGQSDMPELACQEAIWHAWAQSGMLGPARYA